MWVGTWNVGDTAPPSTDGTAVAFLAISMSVLARRVGGMGSCRRVRHLRLRLPGEQQEEQVDECYRRPSQWRSRRNGGICADQEEPKWHEGCGRVQEGWKPQSRFTLLRIGCREITCDWIAAPQDNIKYRMYGMSTLWDINVMVVMREDLCERASLRYTSKQQPAAPQASSCSAPISQCVLLGLWRPRQLVSLTSSETKGQQQYR